jgi:hypothetical protein
MDTSQAAEFLELIGCSGVVRDDSAGLVRGCCPFAHWLHQDKEDKRPTLSIDHLGKARTPTFTCSECGAKGGLPELVYQLQSLTGKLYPEAFMMFSEMPELFQNSPVLPKRRVRVDASAPKTRPAMHDPRKTLPDEVLDMFPLLDGCELMDAQVVIDWLHHDCGIKPSVIFRHKLRLYVDPLIGDLGVALPVLNPDDGCICELWAWVIGSEKPHRILTQKTETLANRRTASALFGIEYVTKGDPVLMVQSPLGAMKLESLGVAKAVAVLGHLTPENLSLGHVSNLYLAFDDTQTGRDMVRVAYKCVNSERTYFLRWSNVRNSRGKHLFSPDDMECLDQFKGMFETRIVLAKA